VKADVIADPDRSEARGFHARGRIEQLVTRLPPQDHATLHFRIENQGIRHRFIQDT